MVVADNLSNSIIESIRRVEKIVGKPIPFHEVDIRDTAALEQIFSENHFDAVIHFAGLKAVGESVAKPLEYYRNNLDSTLSLLEVMRGHDVKKLVFSSSATVYGEPEKLPLDESCRTGVGITNPYGQTKFMIEQILRDVCVADSELEITLLRYFNPVGAHKSGLIGEDPSGIPNNLMPFITQVASGRRQKLSIFGNNYPTPDGTCKRDYVHVVDLAKGHVASLEHLRPGANAYNLGSGSSTSVLEIVNAFIDATGQNIQYEYTSHRVGDLPEFYADPSRAEQELSWKTELSIKEACRDSWRWQLQNPSGFSSNR